MPALTAKFRSQGVVIRLGYWRTKGCFAIGSDRLLSDM